MGERICFFYSSICYLCFQLASVNWKRCIDRILNLLWYHWMHLLLLQHLKVLKTFIISPTYIMSFSLLLIWHLLIIGPAAAPIGRTRSRHHHYHHRVRTHAISPAPSAVAGIYSASILSPPIIIVTICEYLGWHRSDGLRVASNIICIPKGQGDMTVATIPWSEPHL